MNTCHCSECGKFIEIQDLHFHGTYLRVSLRCGHHTSFKLEKLKTL